MTRYLEIAEQVNVKIRECQTLLNDLALNPPSPEVLKKRLLQLMGEIYNLGIRTAPRAVQATVRYNACQKAMQGTGISVRRKEVTPENGGSYTAVVFE